MDDNPYKSPATRGAQSTDSPVVWRYLKTVGLLGILVISQASLVVGMVAFGVAYGWIVLALLSGPCLGFVWRRLSPS